jgi:ribose transport system ATP-binding protein
MVSDFIKKDCLMKSIVELKNISKYFGNSRALHEVDLTIYEGQSLGIVGHNGAGKTTLVNVLTGTLAPTAGELYIDGELQSASYDIFMANKLGIRHVYQELSLCPNLTVRENMRVFHPSISGVGWKNRAERLIIDQLDQIFPGHGIAGHQIVNRLTLGQRQMVEVAKAFTSPEDDLRLIILDEPTSALDGKSSQQLIDYLNSLKNKNLSVIYISHLLDEVIASTEQVMVMKDGVEVKRIETKDTTRDQLIHLMGTTVVQDKDVGLKKSETKTVTDKTEMVYVIEPKKESEEVQITVGKGEVIGLTGLAGHGQTNLLLELFDPSFSSPYSVKAPVTFLPGDRQSDGVFSIWSIVKNLSCQSYKSVSTRGLIDPRKERRVAKKWQEQIDIKAASLSNRIGSLSGGNQQKVIFSRCLESPAEIVLMDDPTRGVDVGTKIAIYELILKEKAKGRSFVWYTTEMDELRYCDRLYVFKGGKIITELTAGDADEEDILKASF